MLVRTETLRKAAEVEALTEVSSTSHDQIGTEADPIDATGIGVVAGANRMLLDLIVLSGGSGVTDTLDPGGADAALDLAQTTGGGNENHEIWELLEAGFPGDGTYTLRWDPDAGAEVMREVVLLEGAAQTTFSDGLVDNSGANEITISVTHPTGSFPAGSLVYAMVISSVQDNVPTVSGDATLDRSVVTGWTHGISAALAKGTLSADDATASVTFTFEDGQPRLRAVILVVEPA